jgi:hypothetical protein
MRRRAALARTAGLGPRAEPAVTGALTLSDEHQPWRQQQSELVMGLFVTFSAEELQEFEEWRKANAKSGEAIVIQAVSKRRPDRFKVWFAKPVADHKKLSWYKPIEDATPAPPPEA